jgi:hypothetical protein
MRRSKPALLGVASLAAACLLHPTLAHANMIWPTLLITGRVYSVPAVAIGYLVEVAVLRKAFRLSWRSAVGYGALANVVSALLGVFLLPLAGIVWEIFPGLIVNAITNQGTFNPISWAGAFAIAVLLTTWVEAQILKRACRVRVGRREWSLWALGNTTSVALAFVSLAIRPIETTTNQWHPWLFF